MDPARRAAFDALVAVHRQDAYANLALPGILAEARLGGRDAAFATELVYGTLRRRATLDEIVAAAAERPVERIDPPTRDALRLGAYQLLFTRVPAHAAVSATVGLVKAITPGATGFANAVLRNVSTASLDDWLDRVVPAESDDPVGHLVVTHSHPAWIVRTFSEALGGDRAELAQALAEDNEPAGVHLCARPGRVDAVALADEVGGAPGAFSPYAVYLPGGPPGELPAVTGGRAHVQDEGSQLVTAALATAPVSEGPAQRWLDLCAGPGGKAALLGGLAAPLRAKVTAVEIAPHRARLVEQAVRGFPVTVVREDGRAVGVSEDLPAGRFDRVLVDAPCTGLGALRRRPEARWRRSPADLPALTRLQRELLVAGIAAARPGGLVAYVTCSPHLVETQVSLAEGRRRSPHPTTLLDARAYFPDGMPGLGVGPTVQLWPHRHGTDAMFLALLRRSA
ncbi:MAG: rRNA small subunit methyltransferase B [Micromonosporaceae bacterium]|nr:rRNA small subunit methyltransferase B [Micromonosporaceae bacterium]